MSLISFRKPNMSFFQQMLLTSIWFLAVGLAIVSVNFEMWRCFHDHQIGDAALRNEAVIVSQLLANQLVQEGTVISPDQAAGLFEQFRAVASPSMEDVMVYDRSGSAIGIKSAVVFDTHEAHELRSMALRECSDSRECCGAVWCCFAAVDQR